MKRGGNELRDAFIVGGEAARVEGRAGRRRGRRRRRRDGREQVREEAGEGGELNKHGRVDD